MEEERRIFKVVLNVQITGDPDSAYPAGGDYTHDTLREGILRALRHLYLPGCRVTLDKVVEKTTKGENTEMNQNIDITGLPREDQQHFMDTYVWPRVDAAMGAQEKIPVKVERDGHNKAGECVQLRIDSESSPPNQVLWESMGYFIQLSTGTAEEAAALYTALLAVEEVETD